MPPLVSRINSPKSHAQRKLDQRRRTLFLPCRAVKKIGKHASCWAAMAVGAQIRTASPYPSIRLVKQPINHQGKNEHLAHSPQARVRLRERLGHPGPRITSCKEPTPPNPQNAGAARTSNPFCGTLTYRQATPVRPEAVWDQLVAAASFCETSADSIPLVSISQCWLAESSATKSG